MDVEKRQMTDLARMSALMKVSHRSVLTIIAACAILSALQTGPTEQPAPDRPLATLTVCLALGTILARQIASRAAASPRVRVTLTLCAYSLAAAIALLGVFVAVTQGAVQTGIVFALGAGIFCLRPPPPIAPARHPDDRAGRAGPAH